MLQLDLFTLRPKLGAAVKFDGTLEQAQEICDWVSSAASDIPLPVRSRLVLEANYKGGSRGEKGPSEIKPAQVYALHIEQPVNLQLSVGSWLVLEQDDNRFKVYGDSWFRDVYESNAPIIETEQNTFYYSNTPSGSMWAEAKTLAELKDCAATWDGPGDLTHFMVTQKITTHAALVTELDLETV